MTTCFESKDTTGQRKKDKAIVEKNQPHAIVVRDKLNTKIAIDTFLQ